MMGRESPEQWPSMSLLSQLLVISTSPPHTQVALARPVQAAHSKRLERMRERKVPLQVSEAVPSDANGGEI